jgi:predicted PurR-regulated permease PerM
MTAATQAIRVLFLVFFMLASGDLLQAQAHRARRLAALERKDALRVIEEIDRQVRRYLGVLLVSNILVGLGTWAVIRVLGIEYAGCGACAAVLHTAPYFGPAIVAARASSARSCSSAIGQWLSRRASSTVAVATWWAWCSPRGSRVARRA